MYTANICFPQQRLKSSYEAKEQIVYFTTIINASIANSAAAESSRTLCDIRQQELKSKMKIASSILAVVLFTSCKQASKQETSIPKGSANEVKSQISVNSITITDNAFVLSLNGVKDTLSTIAQLRSSLEKAENQVKEDTMFIYMKSTITDRMENISPMLRSIDINKYQYVITDDYFALPYAKETDKTE